METATNKSSTFPHLPNQATSKQNGTVSVPVVSGVRNGILYSWKFFSVSCFFLGVLSITNTATFHLVSSKCKLPSYPAQNISVKKGSKFTMTYLNDKIIEYCSVRPPFYKHELHDSDHLSIRGPPSIDNGRIKIFVIRRWCKVVVKNALIKDQGQWELFIDSSDGRSKENINYTMCL